MQGFWEIFNIAKWEIFNSLIRRAVRRRTKLAPVLVADLENALFARIQANEHHVLQKLLLRSRRHDCALNIKTDYDDRNFITFINWTRLLGLLLLLDTMAFLCVWAMGARLLCKDCLVNQFSSIFLLSYTLHKLRYDNFLLCEDDDDDGDDDGLSIGAKIGDLGWPRTT